MWSLKTEALSHQRDAVGKMMPTRIGALFMEMQTGKSRTAIEIAYNRQSRINYTIWYCPVTLQDKIRKEILKHTDCTQADINVFDDKTTDDSLPRCLWHIVGIESMSSSNRVVCAANKLITKDSMVIVDESSYIKGHTSRRTLRITQIAERAKYRLILTGTPISQGVVDLFSQMRFLSPKILGYRSFYSFAKNHLEYSDKYPDMIVRSHNTEYLAAKIKPYVYQVTKDECLDLPEKLYTSRYFHMTSEQRYAYESAKELILYECEDDDWDSVVIFRLFTALQQIVCGYWNYRPRGAKEKEHYEFDHRRVDTLIDTISEIPDDKKIIIWAKYLYDIKQIVEAITAKYGHESIVQYHGNIKKKQRELEIERFFGDARFLVATPSSGGHGHTLSEVANYVIFYNNGFKYSERLQAEDRCYGIGQIHKVTYIDISCIQSIDDRIEAALASKGNVVQQFKAEVNKVKGKKNRIRKLVESL